MEDDIYDFFSLNKDCTEEEIKKAYRKKANETHPDKGGDREEFEKANSYYVVLRDKELRKQYDETGRFDSKPKQQDRYISMALQIFSEVLQSTNDVKQSELFTRMRAAIDKKIIEGERFTENGKREKQKLETALERIEKEDDNKIFSMFLKQKIKETDTQIEQNQDLIQDFKMAYDYIKDCKYKKDEMASVFGGSFRVTVKGEDMVDTVTQLINGEIPKVEVEKCEDENCEACDDCYNNCGECKHELC